MQPYELEAVIENYHKKHKESWEQARLISYITAQVNSTKKLKPTDIIKFSWDEEHKSEEADWNEIKAMREHIKSLQNGE